MILVVGDREYSQQVTIEVANQRRIDRLTLGITDIFRYTPSLSPQELTCLHDFMGVPRQDCRYIDLLAPHWHDGSWHAKDAKKMGKLVLEYVQNTPEISAVVMLGRNVGEAIVPNNGGYMMKFGEVHKIDMGLVVTPCILVPHPRQKIKMAKTKDMEIVQEAIRHHLRTGATA